MIGHHLHGTAVYDSQMSAVDDLDKPFTVCRNTQEEPKHACFIGKLSGMKACYLCNIKFQAFEHLISKFELGQAAVHS